MGRKHYKDNTGGKHSVKNSKKNPSWWEDVCKPNKKDERRNAIKQEKEME